MSAVLVFPMTSWPTSSNTTETAQLNSRITQPGNIFRIQHLVKHTKQTCAMRNTENTKPNDNMRFPTQKCENIISVLYEAVL